jgi:hypothetical protein
VVEQVHERGSEVVDVQRLATRGSGAPQDDLVASVLCGLVEAADQGGQDVAFSGSKLSLGP